MRIDIGDFIAFEQNAQIGLCVVNGGPVRDPDVQGNYIAFGNEYYSVSVIDYVDLPQGANSDKKLRALADIAYEWGYSTAMYIKGTHVLYKLVHRDETW